MTAKPVDTGPKERWQHGDETLVEATESAGQTRVVNLTQDALDWYYRRCKLAVGNTERNRRLYDAGCQLRMDWTKAGLEPRVVGQYSDMISRGSIQGVAGERGDSYKRWQKAVQAVGPIASNEVVTVCCFGNPVGKGAPMEILRRGLAELAGHYGY